MYLSPRYKVIFLFIASLFLIAAVAASSAETIQTTRNLSIQINILDNVTTSPIPGYIVIKNSVGDVITETPTTNSGSAFVSNLIANENYTIIASAKRYQSATRAFVAGDGRTITMGIPLNRTWHVDPVITAPIQLVPTTPRAAGSGEFSVIIAAIIIVGIISYILISRK